MKGLALKGMPVVSMAEGAELGTVDDVLFDPARLRVGALALRAGHDRSILPFEAVGNIGVDAVMVETTAATAGETGQSSREELRALGGLVGLPVMDSEGTILGEVADLEISPADGLLVELEVRNGGVLGLGVTHTLVPAAAIRMIGPKLITVEMPSEVAAAARPAQAGASG